MTNDQLRLGAMKLNQGTNDYKIVNSNTLANLNIESAEGFAGVNDLANANQTGSIN